MRRGLSTTTVIGAAAALADEVGFDAVTISAVARRLEVRTPSLYHHVPSSADLAAGISALALDELADSSTKAIAGRSGRIALLALIDSHRSYAHSHPGRYAAMRQGLRVPPLTHGDQGAAAVLAAVLAAARRHADLLRAVLREYALTGDAEIHAVRLTGSLVQGFAALDLAGGFEHSGPPIEETQQYITDAIDTMLRASGPTH